MLKKLQILLILIEQLIAILNKRVNFLNLVCDKQKQNNVELQLVDLYGEVIIKNDFEDISTSGNIELNLSKQEKGVYYLILRQGERVHTEKIIFNLWGFKALDSFTFG